jgi:probable HAF family extracellular repeat protein
LNAQTILGIMIAQLKYGEWKKMKLHKIFILLLLPCTLCPAGAGFQGFGANNYAAGISADGSTIVGTDITAEPGAYRAFKWTAETGLTYLFASDNTSSSAHDVSGDGSTIVGTYNNLPYSYPLSYYPYYWTAASSVQVIGHFPGGYEFGYAHGISDNGNVIVGISAHDVSTEDYFEAYRWTSTEGMTGLGYLPGSLYSDAKAVSADGSVIVGLSMYGDECFEAFRWTAENGMQGLGDLEGGDLYSAAFNISADGSVIIGVGCSESGKEAFRWTAEDGMLGLGDLEGGDFFSYASEVSYDGSIIMGTASTDLGTEAFYWTKETGMLNLKDVLEEKYDLDLTGWQLTGVSGISADNSKIIGNGINPDGYTEGWMVTIPEPATVTLILLASVFWAKPR